MAAPVSGTSQQERHRILWPTRVLRAARLQIEPNPPTLAETSHEMRRAFTAGEAPCWVSTTRLSAYERGVLDPPESHRAAVLRALKVLSERRRAAAARAEAVSLKPAHRKGELEP
jgi:hypothetical protein